MDPAAFSPDSRQLAVILEGQRSREPVRLLDTDTMKPTTKLDLPGNKPVYGVDVGFSADGRYLAASVQTVFWEGGRESPGYAVVWDLRSPSTPPVRVPTGTEPQLMALSPDGRILYTGWPLTAYRVSTGKRIWRRADITIWGTRRERQGDPTGSRGQGSGIAGKNGSCACLHRGDGPHAAWTPSRGPRHLVFARRLAGGVALRATVS